jgi:hypothetical protein
MGAAERACTEISPKEFPKFVAEASEKLQRIADTYLRDFNEHDAFDYLVAELFETTHEDHFVFTDGPKDGGVDFYTKDPPNYTIYQCKCPDLSSLESSSRPITFDDTAIDELTAAVTMLQDANSEYPVSRAVKRLRTDFQRDARSEPDETYLTAKLAILGDLTPSAGTKFRAMQRQLKTSGVSLQLVNWNDIYRALHVSEEAIEGMEFDLGFQTSGKDILRHSDYCYLLANAVSFYEAFRKYEWNLFQLNVRLQIHNSPINKRIVSCLMKEKTRKRFHHYNNGILLTCDNYRVDDKKKRVRVTGPQIINGCQTVRAICEAYEDLPAEQQEAFGQTARVQVKLIKNTDPDFIADLTITTNDQNPMNQRNLKSNSSEQKDIQLSFRNLQRPWFYERKDGEFKSLLTTSSRVRWFKKSDYTSDGKHFRLAPNDEVAKCWYSFIGNSEKASQGGIDYFRAKLAETSNDVDLYDRIFKNCPNASFWAAFRDKAHFESKEEFFETQIPSVSQYLLAFVISRLLQAKRIAAKQNREQALARGTKLGKLKVDLTNQQMLSTKSEIDEFLTQDAEYKLNIMLNNMKEILLELFGFVLCRRYGPLHPPLCQKCLSMAELVQFIESGCDVSRAPGSVQTGHSVVGPIYEFIRYTMKQYYFENRAEVEAAARLKAYLWDRRVVTKMRESIISQDIAIVDFNVPWKPPGKGFLESLPDLP